MKIEKYEYTKNNNYNIYLSSGEVITINEEVITENELLLKKELDTELYNKLLYEDKICKAINVAIKYITIRLRSKKEISDYLLKKDFSSEIVIAAINKLEKNKYLDDDKFASAFIKDKLNFTTMGDYKIKLELSRLGVASDIIEKNINMIDQELLEAKIKKIIEKDIQKNKKYNGRELKNKIYSHLLSQGYSQSIVINIINTYNF